MFRFLRIGIGALPVACACWINQAFAGESSGISIASYNVENYIVMPRHVGGHLRNRVGKPEEERNAVASVIRSLSPDILGVMEIGDDSQISDLIRRLKSTGLDYPFRESVQGADPERHLLLLSRFPVIERHSMGDIPLSVKGVQLRSPRGVLDVVIKTPEGQILRILCVHLKSRVGLQEYDEKALRLAEAQFLANKVRSILKEDPESCLVVMGDFNATRNSPEMKTLTGDDQHPGPLRMIPLADDRGETWTEFWQAADVYSRIDYVLTSPSLDDRVDPLRSGVARPVLWSKASDHCPVHVTLLNSGKTFPSPTHSR